MLAPALRLRQEAALLSSAGEHEQAVDAWRAALNANPGDARTAYELGLSLVASGRHGEAVAAFERALLHEPDGRASKLALAYAFANSGRAAEARNSFDDLLIRKPDDAEALAGKAASLRHLGQHEAALMLAERAAGIDPGNAEALLEQGRALLELKRLPEAIPVLEALSRQHPEHNEAAQHLARAYQQDKRFLEAAELFRKVAAARPNDPFVWHDLANALQGAKASPEALDAFRRALALKPGFAAAYANMALALADLDRLDEAMHAVDLALSIEPDSHTVLFLRANLLLMRGEYREGWKAYEDRFFRDGPRGLREDIHAAPWHGEPIEGRSILVLGEQANGDYIQFSTWVKALTDRGAKVAFFVPARLARLLSTLPGDVRVIEGLDSSMRFDFQCHLMSLPHRLGLLGVHDVPTEPWLHAEPELVAHWRSRIGPDGFRVGVAWQGSNNDARSFNPLHLAPLARIPGVRLISLHTEKAVPAASFPPGFAIESLGAEFDDGADGFIDTAAAITALDLVISCDTAIPHLAGALGKPAWIALNNAPEWRWRRGVDRAVWYPKARLFRQATRMDWDGVFRRISEELAGLVAARRAV